MNSINSIDELKRIKYDAAFEDEMAALQHRRESDPTCMVEDIEAVLQNFYIREGDNINGRGQIRDIIMSAVIAAHELFIIQWKAELNDKTG
ncbi:MAG: hypothetical protein FWD91_06815 [Treponema sp.]|nr:hypothetical protein [Treponema sp.]